MESEHTPQPRLTGHTVVDSSAEKVGTVTDVLYEATEDVPAWAIIRTGALGGEHFVPLADTYVDAAGQLVVPFPKRRVKHAPKVRGIHALTPELDRELRDYYGEARPQP